MSAQQWCVSLGKKNHLEYLGLNDKNINHIAPSSGPMLLSRSCIEQNEVLILGKTNELPDFK